MSEIETAAPVVETPATPAATPAPLPDSTAEQVETPEGETTPEAQVEERVFKQSEVDKIVQKRLGTESRRLQKVAEAEARASYAERQLAELRAPAQPAQPSGEPVPQNFKDYESYIAALTDWKVDQKLGGIRKQSEAQQQQRQMQERAAQVMPKLKTAMEKYDDFHDVATSYDAPPAMQAAMLDSDHTGELYYYLGSNPDERARIERLSEIKQVIAIRDLEAKITAAPNPTRTPAPIVPNSGKAPVSKSLSDMSVDEFFAAREKRLKAQRRR